MKFRLSVVLATCVLFAATSYSQCVSLTALGSTYTQDFNTLASTGTANTALPAGWLLAETGTSSRNNGAYAASNGSDISGDVYSFGSTSADRAFGTLLSGTLTPTIGACFTNNTGATITSMSIAYTGEEWRFGTVARGADRLDFQFSTNATSLTTGTWTDANALDFSTPNTSIAVGIVDGNATGNRTAISSTIGTVSVPNGTTFWIRWTDFNASGSDDGLAVDDFSLTPSGTTTLSINDVSANEGDSGTTTFNFVVTLSNPAPASGVTFDIATQDNTATTADNDYIAASASGSIPAGATTFAFPVTVNGDINVEPTETFFVNITNITGGVTVAKSQATGTILTDDISTAPSGVATANPTSVDAGDSTTLTVVVTPGSKPVSTGITVTGDLHSIGGSATQAFDNSGNTFTFSADVAADTVPGPKTLQITVADAQGRSSQTNVSFTVNQPPAPADHLVISQVYGGGGNSNATYQNDFVELYNPMSNPVDLAGWTIQYASATGSSWNNFQPLGGVIGAHEYFLIALASGGATGAPLPAANIVGSINMSATSGKIALVHKGTFLVGVCPFPTDPAIVDFVGYGTSALCAETNNAPGISNTLALFRKDNGNTDTNNNAADFFAATPNPRRTAPIVEIGPAVINTDPGFDGTNAAHDSSITVNFTEAVDTIGNWYDVTCDSSGAHNSATISHTSDYKSWVITPNANFTFGEKCIVTVFQNGIADQDTDDSAPNTNNLAADYQWHFTVVGAGSPPPYTADVHLTMGNPSNAVADVNVPNNFLMDKPTYALSYNRDKGTPNWVSWHLASEWYGTLARVDTFRPDPAVPPDWYRVQAFDFSLTGFDRGHMCPNADRDNQNRIPINQETYLMSNMVPQAPDNNQGPWANLENYLRSLTDAGNEIYIVSGPQGVGGTGSNGFMTSVAGGHVTVPANTWKVALVLPKADGDDVARVTAATRTIAVLMPNIQGIRTNNSNDWQGYLTTVHQVETLTGYNLFSSVPDAIRNAINNGVNGDNPPGTANESVSTKEDHATTIAFDAVDPAAAPLTFTTSTPSHGALSGTGNSVTYTPSPDFNGTDSFTYSATNGTKTSNTATVSVTVLEVNDPPVTVDDAKNVEAGSVLTFAATDLSSNDMPGPDNESSQTLTVTSVSGETHGIASLTNGQVTFTPEVAYSGPASFTYQVCDNGFTAGVSDPKCATGTVNVSVVDTTAPAMTGLTLSATQLWPPSHQMVDVNVGYASPDLGDAAPVCTLTLASNEPINGLGDGDTAPDWEIVDAHHVRLRAERAATGTGRIYTIAATCTDASGNAAQKSANVSVPKSNGGK